MFRRGRIIGIVLVLAFWGLTMFRHADSLQRVGSELGLVANTKNLLCKVRSHGDAEQARDCLERRQ